MKKLIFLFLLFGTYVAAHAQVSLTTLRVQNYVPTGACVLPNQLTMVSNVGLYQCVGGVWSQFLTGTGAGPARGAAGAVQSASGVNGGLADSGVTATAGALSATTVAAQTFQGVIGTTAYVNYTGYGAASAIQFNLTSTQFKYSSTADSIGYFAVDGANGAYFGLNADAQPAPGAGYVQAQVGFIEALTTPASSTAACTAGTFTDDANYHYVCVATNTWKRVALTTF